MIVLVINVLTTVQNLLVLIGVRMNTIQHLCELLPFKVVFIVLVAVSLLHLPRLGAVFIIFAIIV